MSQDAFIAQYRECYQHLRAHDALVWQTPSIAATINGALIVVAFRYIQDIIVREVLLLLGMVLTTALLYALIKHRYFLFIEQQSLTKIEKELNVKHIQRTTLPYLKNDEYWFSRQPRWYHSCPAYEVLKWSVILMLVLLVFLFAYPFFRISQL